MLLLTLRGTPTIYQGEEIGMADVPIPTQAVRDPWEKNVPGLGLGRDPERTPMQWDASENAGFTAGDPWLPLSADRATVNVATQRDDPASMFSLYRQLIALRRREPALAIGVHVRAEAVGDVLTYRRFHQGRWITVALNFVRRAADVPQWRQRLLTCCSPRISIARAARTASCNCARTRVWCWRRRRSEQLGLQMATSP